jgi:type I restriction enzyme S subunit
MNLGQHSAAAAQPGLAVERIANLAMPIPSQTERVFISRFLAHADRRIRRYIRAKRKLIALLNEQKQIIITRAVTRGLDPNVRLRSSGVEWLREVPEHWEVWSAKYFFREVDERSVTGTEELLSVSHITGVTPRSQKSVTMFMASSYVDHKVCRRGDLVINTMWAWMAALGVARHTGIVSPSYAVYRPLRPLKLLSDYADLLLRTRPYVSEYICRSTGIRSSRLRLYPEQFLRMKLVCPPTGEQQAILDSVRTESESAERAIVGAQREIDLLREFWIRLIADVITGKLDVRDAAVRLPIEAAEQESLDDLAVLTGGDEEAAGENGDTATDEAEA